MNFFWYDFLDMLNLLIITTHAQYASTAYYTRNKDTNKNNSTNCRLHII
jgi:hypothetical protein